MKSLILIFLLCSNCVWAGNWMSKAHVINKNNGLYPTTVYVRRIDCISIEGQACFETTAKDMRYHAIKKVRKGPYEAAIVIEPCADETNCLAQIADPLAKCGDVSFSALWGDLESDGNLESWCTRLSLVDELQEDSTLKTQAQSDDAAKVIEIQARETKRIARKNSLKTCATSPGLSAPEQQACLIAIAKELMRAEIPESDL